MQVLIFTMQSCQTFTILISTIQVLIFTMQVFSVAVGICLAAALVINSDERSYSLYTH